LKFTNTVSLPQFHILDGTAKQFSGANAPTSFLQTSSGALNSTHSLTHSKPRTKSPPLVHATGT